MLRISAFLLAVIWLSPGWASADAYDYPIDNKFLATVVGTPPSYRAELPKKIPLRHRSITIFGDRKVPEPFFFDAKLRYSQALQKGSAPLVFLIAGTGAAYNGAKNVDMARAFYQAGFHVISISSPTYMNFIVAASRSGVPGHTVEDAEDIYRVMERIWGKLEDRIEVTDFYVTGYSLGGLNAAFVTWLDETKQVFNFRKALLINPPVRLYSSISLLDRMLDNIPGGIDNFPQFYDRLVKQLTRVYKNADTVDIGEDFLYKAFEAVNPDTEELAALIGVSFRISSANMTYTTDLMTDFGYIKPKNITMTKNSSPSVYNKVAHRLSFTDYYHVYFYPFQKAKNPSLTRSQLINDMSLSSIEDYLRGAEKIEVMHNLDDIILEPGEIDFFPRVFGDRAKIYPRGGHLGNMDFRDNVTHMVNVFSK
ncbi:MAG: alpha/beta hydrolase [Gammaproteobacteria bacterium]|nr:MAG: alpha/beta hydrolase [Gammaproteobacteria bacterium]RLA48252.1 MAG: alpha/beta hydrolase [Gammaproteobacteria bacterium]